MKRIISWLLIIIISSYFILITFGAATPGFIPTLKGIYGVSQGTFGFGMTDGSKILLSWPDGENWTWLTLNQNGKMIGDLMSKARSATASNYMTMAEYIRDLENNGWRYMNQDELQPFSGIVRGLLAWLGIPGFAGLGGAAALKRRTRK